LRDTLEEQIDQTVGATHSLERLVAIAGSDLRQSHECSEQKAATSALPLFRSLFMKLGMSSRNRMTRTANKNDEELVTFSHTKVMRSVLLVLRAWGRMETCDSRFFLRGKNQSVRNKSI